MRTLLRVIACFGLLLGWLASAASPAETYGGLDNSVCRERPLARTIAKDSRRVPAKPLGTTQIYQEYPVYAIADGCISFANITPQHLIGLKLRINDRFPNAAVWYLNLAKVLPKFANDGRAGRCIAVRKGELVGYTGSYSIAGDDRAAEDNIPLQLNYVASGLVLNDQPFPGVSTELGQGVAPSPNTVGAMANSVIARQAGAAETVPRLCKRMALQPASGQGLPINRPGGSGYTASPLPPTPDELAAAQATIKKTLGLGDARNQPAQIANPTAWKGGVAEQPDWDSYKDMSFDQIIRAEIARRTADARWAEDLTKQSERGLQVERLWMEAMAQRLRYEIIASKQRQEAMRATLQAAKVKRLLPLTVPTQ
ncbi:MAG: hypothetical protein JNM52_07775 [Betaproteobacteria bacterium]|nr:hypothetical protein [Betaproteobacteria bacterium]